MGESLLQLLGGALLLYLGGELLVSGASGLARRAGLSQLAIGLTVVAFGTSAPELVVSGRATLDGLPGIALGNVVGSNVCNVLLILGLSAVIRPMRVRSEIVRREVPVMILFSALALLLLRDGRLVAWEGALLLGCLLVSLALAWRRSRAQAPEDPAVPAAGATRSVPWWRSAAFVLLGLGLLTFGASFFVAGAVTLATAAGLGAAAIGLTVVAVGTSLPELSTSVVAALRGQDDIAIGNVVGSNVFNLLGILGACALLRPLTLGGLRWSDLWLMLAVALLVLPLARSGWRLSRVEGGLMLVGYAAWTAWQLAGAGAA